MAAPDDVIRNSDSPQSIKRKWVALGDGSFAPAVAVVGAAPGGGDASAANQVTGNNSLANIDTKTSTVITGLASIDGRGATGNASLSSIDGKVATAAAQATGNASLGSLDTKSTAANASLASLDTKATARNTSLSNIDGKLPALSGGSVPVAVQNTLNITSRPATSGGLTSTRVITAGGTLTVGTLKAAAGQLYGMQFGNNGASWAFVKVYNKASNPAVATDVPIEVLGIPPGGAREFSRPIGIAASNGLAYAITGAVADADSTIVAANQVFGSFQVA